MNKAEKIQDPPKAQPQKTKAEIEEQTRREKQIREDLIAEGKVRPAPEG